MIARSISNTLALFLSSLPNLHTFQVFHAKEDQKTEIRNVFQSVILRRIRTLIIALEFSSVAHR